MTERITTTTTAAAAGMVEHAAAITTRVRLESSMFVKALEDYIDENKPDPLVRKQMQAWEFEWHDDGHNNDSINDNYDYRKGISENAAAAAATAKTSILHTAANEITSSWPAPPTHLLSGRLRWEGEYMSIPIDVRVYWNGAKEGSLFFSCTIPSHGVEFLPPSPTAAATTTTEAQDDDSIKKKEMRAANRVHQSMMERLQKDD
jgi:hypothetical protein